jgi:hypothetical protein
VLRQALLCPLFSRHVPQTVVRYDAFNWVVFLALLRELSIFLVLEWVQTTPSDLFIARELVNGEADVWRRVLSGRGCY